LVPAQKLFFALLSACFAGLELPPVIPQWSSAGGFRTPLNGRVHTGVNLPGVTFAAGRRVLVFPDVFVAKATTNSEIARNTSNAESVFFDFVRMRGQFIGHPGVEACGRIGFLWRRIGNELVSSTLVVHESFAIDEHKDVCAAYVPLFSAREICDYHSPPESYFLIFAKDRFDDEVQVWVFLTKPLRPRRSPYHYICSPG
jgi:hypothetical protein